MTAVGICDVATWEKSRLSVGRAKKYLPKHRRTITYWRDDLSSWRATLDSCRDLAELGVKNLIVFNPEAHRGTVKNVGQMQNDLHKFLEVAKEEFSYVDQDTNEWRLPVHGIESLNEIDTPGWNDGEGGKLTIQKILDYAYGAEAVVSMFSTDKAPIECISPSFLGGPKSDMPVQVLSALANDQQKRIRVAAFHMYGRSVGGAPSPAWIWGTVEDGVKDLTEYIGDMQIDLTEGGCWTVDGPYGETGQARFVEQFCRFQHPRVRRMYLFALNDWCPFEAEYLRGKDFGIETRDHEPKPAAAKFNGGLVVRKPQPTPNTPGPDYTYVLGFRKFHARLVADGIDPGPPAENEWGPWPKLQQQLTVEKGMFVWADLADIGGRMSYTHGDGRRFRWDESWATVEEVRR